jgi:hypothetical protein
LTSDKETTMKNLTKIAIVTLGLAFSLAGFTRTAEAAVLSDCRPSSLWLDFRGAPSSSRLGIVCSADSRTYYTNPNASCPSRSLDVVKAWEALATSALLSGKRLSVEYTTCGVDRSIDSLEIVN